MAQDADDATTALIARLLAEDAGGYGGGGYGPDDFMGDSDDEWGGSKKKKKGAASKKKAAPDSEPKRKAKKENVPPAGGEDGAAENGAGADGVALTATGRRKRKDAGSRRAPSKKYSEEEEAKFQEGLRTLGRDWKGISALIGTRDPRSVSSHAQKHFVQLCLQGKPLPTKVRESGDGYTLSGKPLDPLSSAARAYGFRPDTLHEGAEGGAEGAGGDAGSGSGSEDEAPEEPPAQAASPPAPVVAAPSPLGSKRPAPEGPSPAAPVTDTRAEDPPAPAAEPAPVSVSAPVPVPVPAPAPPVGDTAAEAEGRSAPVRKKAKRKGTEERLLEEEAARMEEERAAVAAAEYRFNRPRREATRKGSGAVVGLTSESTELLQCSDWVAQPFSVDVHSSASVVMDFHAHLSSHEIIGLLGGTWDPVARRLVVREAFPCRRALGSEASTSVELDASSEVEVRAQMEGEGLVPVGWYHSHPTFAPNPSIKDCDNQRNMQALFRDPASGIEPCLGAIVAPYDLTLQGRESLHRWFAVRGAGGGEGAVVPVLVRHEVKLDAHVPSGPSLARLRALIAEMRHDRARIPLTELWRPFTSVEEGRPRGGPLTKLAKLRGALYAHLQRAAEGDREGFLDTLATELQEKWGLDLGY